MYNPDDLFNTAVETVTKNKPHSLNMLIALMGISRETFYTYFPTGSDRHKRIQQEINTAKGKIKAVMFKKWFDSENPTLQIAYMKLLADEDELRALTNQHNSFEIQDDMEITINIKK
jgi:hypothetical protein